VFRRHIAALAHGADFARPDCGKGAGAMTMSCNDAGTNPRTSTLRSDNGKRTYIMTTRRITSGEELK